MWDNSLTPPSESSWGGGGVKEKRERCDVDQFCGEGGRRVSPPLEAHLVFRTIREGMGPRILSIIAKCSLLSWVWGGEPGRGC